AKSLLSRIFRDNTASAAIWFGLLAIPLVGSAAIGIDGARSYLVKTRLSHAIDAAALAGGGDLASENIVADIKMYFDANYVPGFLGSVLSNFQVIVSDDNETVKVTATVTLPTTFATLLGFDNVTVSEVNVARRSVRGMELVLVMDNTGSMRSGGKMSAMKNAAKGLVDTLYGGRDTVNGFWVGLVPYVAAVNIGNQHQDWVTELNQGAFQPTIWKGCVVARKAPFDQSDLTPFDPGNTKFKPFHWDTTINDYQAERANRGWIGDNDWTPGVGGSVDERNAAQNNGYGPNLGCGPALTPLTAARSTVIAAIDEMQPWHRGGTMANQGLAWGWRTLSPRWRGLWGGDTPAALPLDYNSPSSDKVVILLTDGTNQWYDWPGGLPGKPDNNRYPDADYTTYGRLSEARLGTTSQSGATAEINTRMLASCQTLKDLGVIVYTITFRVNSSSTRALYEQCASNPEKYYNSPNNAELADVFQTIGSELSNLRLEQ
ncbi:MAG: pilus assembly protein TadG-related protein, partial [Alphaproteobacteria bacterium]